MATREGIDRRRFLTYLVAAPTLTVAARYGWDPLTTAPAEAQSLPYFGQTLLVQVTPENRVVLQLQKIEFGQGINTSAAMLVAEEIDARLEDVDSAPAPTGQTHSSTSITDVWEPIRAAAAEVRARLVTAAAQEWDLDASTLETRDTMVIAPDGRTASYGSLSEAAARVLQPEVSTQPKPYAEHRVIGKRRGRMDARDIVTGKAKYAMDFELPGALAAVLARPPTIGGTPDEVDDRAARAMPGVEDVVVLANGVAVCAQSMAEALDAVDQLLVRWGPGTMDDTSDADIQASLALLIPPSTEALPTDQVVEGTFEFATVNHAPMEVLNAVADVRADGADIWVASQEPDGAITAVSEATRLPAANVKLHQLPAGGAFGRRIYHDAPVEAAQISQVVGRPVKLLWTRYDDTRHGRVRPPCRHQVRATHAAGDVLSWTHHAASGTVEYPPPMTERFGVDPYHEGVGQLLWRAMVTMPYDFPVVASEVAHLPLEIPTGTWRAVYAGTARAVEEILVDELAAAMGEDPVAFRRQRLKDARARAVLDHVASEGDWGRAMPAGWAQGVALQEEFGSVTACLVELDATDPMSPRVTKAVIAVDVGRPVNPTGVEAQVMGAAMDGFATTLRSGVTIRKGAVQEGTFGEFRWPRQGDAPIAWKIHVMAATGEPGGLGELGVPSAAGAAANAYARATGTKPRRFPIISEGVS